MPISRGSRHSFGIRCRWSCEFALTSLITGAAGFVGQHLVRELLGAGHQVIGGTLGGAPPSEGVLREDEVAAVRWVRFDVTDEAGLAAVLGEIRPERVFHLAAQSSVGAAFTDVLGTWDVNATGTLRLLTACREQDLGGGRVLFVSSAEVYGPVPEAEQPIRETRPLHPINPYGASKAAGEMVALQEVAAAGLDVVIARSFNHTGPGQARRFALANWAAQLAEMRRGERQPVLQVGNLQARRDLLDVRDVVRAYRFLIEQGQSGGAYNVCSGEAYSLEEVVRQLVELSGTGAQVEVDADRLRPVDTPLLCGDPARIRQLGWIPQVPLRTTLVDLLAASAGETVV